jgi:quercetin dioxygenase-like cupin family protein
MPSLPRTLLLAVIAAFAPALVAQPASVKYAPPSQTTPMGTTFVDWDSLNPKTTPVGLSRSVFDSPTPTLEKFEVHITTLRPGMTSHAEHHHPWEEMLLVKEGTLEVSINGQKHSAGPGSLVFFALGTIRISIGIGIGSCCCVVVFHFSRRLDNLSTNLDRKGLFMRYSFVPIRSEGFPALLFYVFQ